MNLACVSLMSEPSIWQSHLVWDPWRDFEMQLLEQTKKGEARQAQINRIRALYRDRLRVPHRSELLLLVPLPAL